VTDATQSERLVGRLRAARAALEAQRGDVEAGAPWALSDTFGTEPEATWGPLELLAHVGEMLPFWLGEIERVLAGPNEPVPFGREPVPFGRIASDPLRIGLIERDRTLPVREHFARIAAAIERYERRVAELTDAELARTGLHPTLGVVAVAGIVERFVIAHLEDHARQLEEILGG